MARKYMSRLVLAFVLITVIGSGKTAGGVRLRATPQCGDGPDRAYALITTGLAVATADDRSGQKALLPTSSSKGASASPPGATAMGSAEIRSTSAASDLGYLILLGTGLLGFAKLLRRMKLQREQ
jgi:hypothetical protein